METPVLESGISRFRNPNLVLKLRAIWTWIAVATFNSLFRRLSRVIVRLRVGKSVAHHPSSSTSYDSDSDSDDGDVSCSSSDDEDEDGDDEDDVSTADSAKDTSDFEDVQGPDGGFDEDLSWPMELARDQSVVKLWDGDGRKGWDEISAARVASPGMTLSAGTAGLKVWDPRSPESECAAYRAVGLGRVVGILGGGDDGCKKVYVAGSVGRLTVVDLRNVKSPLAETWWWSDGAVTVGDGEGLVPWWPNAARSLAR